MSDDEYPTGACSPYSDLDELLYESDSPPDLADDLAANTVHDPVYTDIVPGDELDECFSDWDYYSDDYYDDDPTVLKNKRQPQSPKEPGSRAGADANGSQKRGKKRKLTEVDGGQDSDLGQSKAFKACMRGTVWAKPIPERDNVFVSGQCEKIALLKNWRQVFGTSSIQDKRTSKRPHLAEDESWANEMSLADMGLQSEKGPLTKAAGVESVTEPAEAQEEEGAGLDDETRGALLQHLEGLDEEQALALVQHAKSKFGLQLPSATSNARPKPLPLSHTRLAEALESPAANGGEVELEDGGQGQPKDTHKNKHKPTTDTPDALSHKAPSQCSNAGRVKKRKASVSLSPEPDQARPCAPTSSHMTRVTSSVKHSKPTETADKRDGGNASTTRSSRSRKDK